MQNYFSTNWQRVIFRNYGLAPTENIAKALKTDVQTIKLEAERLGLKKVEYNPDWLKKGYVTIIRNNWDILPDEQIIVLLDMQMPEYKKLLVEYDFLDVKLGEKPEVEQTEYSALTEEQILATEKICKIVEEKYCPETVKPFDFFNGEGEIVTLPLDNCSITDRFTSHYYADYSGALLDDELSDYSEEYLARLSATGINGVWLHESLKNLSEFPFDPEQSKGYEVRVKNLKKLTERAGKYGINIYLYFNEPRSQSEEFFIKYPELRGQKCNGGYCMCTSKQAVKDYLYNAVKSLAESVPKLKAIMTITMSENPTHCYSRPFIDDRWTYTECPDCKNRPAEEITAEINNIMARAVRDGNGDTKIVANLWGWAEFADWTDDMIFHGIDLLEKDVEVLCVSEFSKNFKRGGVKGQVADYSISVIGPSDITVKMLKYAKEKGHRIWAKIQANSSWECSSVPYIPAFDRMVKHIENLKKLGVTGMMMGWSLGGFPGGALPLCSSACNNGKVDQTAWYNATYKDNGKLARKAVKAFSKAFANFPFSIASLYFGGQSLGSGNFLDFAPDNRESTMVCYTFDDYKKWTEPYSLDIYISLLERLVTKWQKGLALINGVNGNANFEEFKRSAEGTYLIMQATLNTAKFAKYKVDVNANKDKLKEILECEADTAEKMYKLMATDAKIGYEVTNHYFANRQRILEKIINVNALLEKLN